MCGIGGVRRFGEEPITKQHIKQLLISLERRGNHATGVALTDGREIFVHKDHEPAWKYVASREFNGFLDDHLGEDTIIALVHTRWATSGDPRDMRNNHPVFVDKTALVHNGCVDAYDSTYKDFKLEKYAEVDTDIMRLILDKYGFTKEGFKQLRKLSGTAAIAAISTEYPGKLLLARSGSPLVVASVPGFVMFASEKAAIHSALRPYRKRYGIWGQAGSMGSELLWSPMNDDTLWMLGDLHEVDGEETVIEFHEIFNVCGRTYSSPNYDIMRSYRGHSRRWPTQRPTEREVDVYSCRNPKCGIALNLPERLAGKDLTQLYCPKCGWSVQDPKSIVEATV